MKRFGLAGLLAIQLASNASGAIVSFSFSGTLNYVNDPSHVVPGGVAFDAPFTGILTYDTGANVDGIDYDSSPDSGDFYFGTNGGFSVEVTIAGHTFCNVKHTEIWPSASIIIHNDYYGVDSFQAQDSMPHLRLDDGPFPGTVDDGGIYLEFEDDTASAFGSDALPTAALDVANFANIHRLEIYGIKNHNTLFDIGGKITGITAPQPTLQIRRQPSQNVTVSWPLAAQGFKLLQNTNLSTGAGWQTNLNPIIDTATEHTVTLPTTSGQCLLRLKSP
jgi:hypothetical protein